MRKLILVITIAVISSLIFSCTKDNMEDEIIIQQVEQVAEGDWNGNDLDDDDDDDDEENVE